MGSPEGPTRARRREECISINAEAVDLGLSGSELGEDAPEAQRLLAQGRPHPVVALGRSVPLVEDQVDRLEHR
jgi:hypothetical protein